MGKRMMTIDELRRELAARESELAPLEARREKLARQLTAVDKEIAALLGEAAPARGRRRKRGRKAGLRRGGRKPGRARQGRGRKPAIQRRPEKPLAEYIEDALRNKKGGMKVTDIAKAVQAAGYQTMSKNFYAVVNVLLGKDKRFQKLGPGLYKLV